MWTHFAMLLLTPNEILKKMENRVLLSTSEFCNADPIRKCPLALPFMIPLISRNFGRLVLGSTKAD